MGNCCHPFGITNESSKKRHKKVVLLLVGLDNAGKTTTAKTLVGEPVDAVVPTVGFSSVSLMHQGCNVTLYDLGGGPQIRGIWHRYFVDVHGLIFVVDASDNSRLDEGRVVLESLLTHEKLAGKPMLLLANKQDNEGALDELDIVEQLNLEALVNQQRCPTLVEMCSATAAKNARKKADPAIHNGFKWLMNCIIRDYNNLNKRVEEDVAVQKKIQEQEKKERLERVLRAREERGEGSSIGNGMCNGGMQEENDSDSLILNPFKPISELVTPTVPPVEPGLENRIILVKESPNKAMPDSVEIVSAESNDALSDVHDIEGEEVILVESIENKNTLKPDAGDNKKWLFGSPVSVGKFASPTHSVTELIKDQLTLEGVKNKKQPLLRRTNRTAPAPLGPRNTQITAGGSNVSEIEKEMQFQNTSLPKLRKQAFVDQTEISRAGMESPIVQNAKEKQSPDRSNLFCIHSDSISLDQLANADSAVEIYMTNSADSKNKRRPLMGKLSLKNARVQPTSAETSLSSSCNMENFQSSVESEVTVVKQMSSGSVSLSGSQDLKKINEQRKSNPTTPIRQWEIDKFSLENEKADKEFADLCTVVRSEPSRDVTERQSSIDSESKKGSRQNSSQSGEVRLQRQISVDEPSIGSPRSRPGSRQLSDSGFVSPKNILPPIRPTSSTDRQPLVLPPISSRGKHSSQDSILDFPEERMPTNPSNYNEENKSENTQASKSTDSLQ